MKRLYVNDMGVKGTGTLTPPLNTTRTRTGRINIDKGNFSVKEAFAAFH